MIVPLSAIAAVCVAMSVLLTGPLPVRASSQPSPRPEISRLKRFRPALAALAGGAGWAFVGGPAGVLVGGALAAFAWRTLGKARSPDEIRRDAQMRADYPLVVELLAHALAAGSDVETAFDLVGRAVGGPWETRLSVCLNALRLGQTPDDVWAELEREPLAAGLGRALARSHQTGVPISRAMRSLAFDAREESELAAYAYARTIEVRAAAPLGVCFLPAFVLLGIVPLVAGVLRGLAWSGA